MNKSCAYCGKIHPFGYVCPMKPKSKNYSTNSAKIQKFRNSSEWQNKREQIKERDLFCCRICLENKKITTDKLSVHHILPLEKHFRSRLDDNNLITLCPVHHKQADNGDYSTDYLSSLANEKPRIKGSDIK